MAEVTVKVNIDEDALRESFRKIVDEMREELREEFKCSCHQRPTLMFSPPPCPCGWRPAEGVIGGETLAEHQAFCTKAPRPEPAFPGWLTLHPIEVDCRIESNIKVDDPAYTLDHLFAMRNRDWSTR